MRSLFLGLLTLTYLSSCTKKKIEVHAPTSVTVMKVVPQTIPADFEFVAVAESSHIVEIRARVEGYLETINYVEGGLVKKGDLMFTLDQRTYIAQLEMAKGELAREQALLWDAQQSKARMVPLYSQNAVSQRDLDNAIARELAAEANVITAGANVDKASVDLSYCSITAPVTGMASKAVFREGALISPGPNNLMTTIYVLDPIWVNICVSEGVLLQTRKELNQNLIKFPEDKHFNIEIIFADGTVFPAEGTIDFTSPNLQQSTGTMLVRTVAANPDGLILPGMFLKAIVKGATRPNAIIVPQTAVQQGQRGAFVYVVDQNNKASIRMVNLGDWYKDYWIITSGLKKDDIVIAEGTNRVQNNFPVQIISWISSMPKTGDNL